MQLQKAMARSQRMDYLVESIQMVSGLLLVLFLWTHMLFVAAIWLGVHSFNALAAFMEDFGLLPATVVFLILVITLHVGAVIRRVPRAWEEQKIVWRHAKLIRHSDTWSWIFQVVTGFAMLALAIVHMAVVVYGGINANLSSARVHGGFLVFYAVLLLLSEYHASVGLYRIFVKWGWVSRHSLKRVLGVISILTVAIGAITLWIFYTLGSMGAAQG
jgi:fumarate reductase subunit C